MKKQGLIQLSRHMIGYGKPIVAILGVSALYGCGDEGPTFRLYTELGSCKATETPEACDKKYQIAQAEAKRTAMKFYAQRDCEQDYGSLCTRHEDVYEDTWQPKMAGFISNIKDANFALPFFTSANPKSSHFGYSFLADGNILDKFSDSDKLWIDLPENYIKPLPNSFASSGDENNIKEISEGDDSTSLSSFTDTLILAEMLDETGDYLTERERNKRYKECKKRNGSDCYKITSGTAKISTKPKAKPKLKEKQVKSYKSSPKVTSVSKGGFGRTGSVRGGFGG